MKYLHKFCFVYVDDIVIFSKSLQEHSQHLKLIFEELKRYGLKIQLDKSEFLRIKPNPDKIKTILKYLFQRARLLS